VTSQVTRGTLTVAVAGNGTVVSQNQSSVNPAISGKVTKLKVGVGDRVTKGDVLFIINNPALDASVEQAKSSYQTAKASRIKAEQAELQADISLSTGVLQAKQTLQQAKASVASAKSSLAKAQAAVPLDSNAVDAATDSLAAAKTGQKTAQKNYNHACRLQRQGHSAAAESYSAAVTSQHAAKMQYDQAIQNADERTVTAPISGYITTLSINNGDQIGSSSGSSSSSRTSSTSTNSSSSSASAPIVISDLSRLQAQVQIAETDRPKVKLDQKVEVTFDAVSNLTITGKVTQIDAVGTSSSGVVTYNVTVSFDVQDKRLNPGMTASASIVTKVIPDAILVPNAAIKTDSSGASYVQVLATPTGTPQDVTVTVGPAGDTNTQVLTGLTGNESVVTQTITAASAATSGSRSGLSVLGGGGAARGAAGGGFRGGN
jgi:multidrug efflux pump subunit AcrA (membrane-fusion protein)